MVLFVVGLWVVGLCFFFFLCDLSLAQDRKNYHTMTITENTFLPSPKPELVVASFL